MSTNLIPLHCDWIQELSKTIQLSKTRVAFVSSYNEEVLLSRALSTKRIVCRIGVINHLDPEQIIALCGCTDSIIQQLQMSQGHVQSFLINAITQYYQKHYQERIAMRDAIRYAQSFITLHNARTTDSFFEDITPKPGARYHAEKDLYQWLASQLANRFDSKALQNSLRSHLLKHISKDESIVIGVSQPLDDSASQYVRTFCAAHPLTHLLVQGEQGSCNEQDLFFYTYALGIQEKSTPSLTQKSIKAYSCTTPQHEIEHIAALLLNQEDEILVTSPDLLFLRNLMAQLRAQGTTYWNGLGDFFWDTQDGQWILACGEFLHNTVTPTTLHQLLSWMWEENPKRLWNFDKKHLRKGLFFFESLIESLSDGDDRSDLQNLALLKKCYEDNPSLKIMHALVEQRPFQRSDAFSMWSKHKEAFSDIHITSVSSLKALCGGTLMHKRQQQKILVIHMNDVRLYTLPVMVVGLHDQGKKDDLSPPPDHPCIRYKMSNMPDILNFLGCMSRPHINCFWHKTDGTGGAKRVSVLWQHALQKSTCTVENIPEKPGFVSIPTRTKGAKVSSSHVPTPCSVTDIALLLDSPYDFYLKKVLNLTPLNPLGDPSLQKDTGIFIHSVLEQKGEMADIMRYAAKQYHTMFGRSTGDLLWYKIAYSIMLLRQEISSSAQFWVEKSGILNLTINNKVCTIRLRADRCDYTGKELIISDFKTGSRARLNQLARDVPVGWQLVCEGIAACDNTLIKDLKFSLVSLAILHTQGRSVYIKKVKFSKENLENLRSILQDKMRPFFAHPTTTFDLEESARSFYSDWLLS
ncbi:MAG: PD-(D/E)XK nuclease family protein [Alphaproteobacteria bacterium]|nr:PD-(D/E)XK nuclease family protein [Alphaproteobacteria bacterium]